jgi:predicted nucleic acid-binding protein
MILTDTGYWLALANKKDRYHKVAIEVTATLDSELIITWPVITEACHLIGTRLGSNALVKFLEQIELTTSLFEIKYEHLAQIRVLMKKYSNLPMDMADASLVIVAQELKTGNILSTDCRDFNAYRWKNTQPFTNLLLN